MSIPQPQTHLLKRYPKSIPAAAASVLLLSPTNDLLLLHRVNTSTAFPSAHVFPGGGLSEYHEDVPPANTAARHVDGPAYRLAAIRETFEESGILLARSVYTNELLQVAPHLREEGRRLIHGDKMRFTDWLARIGGVADVDALIPFTRWITPTTVPKRFTTQMYIYMLPVSSPPAAWTPSHDGGLEHTAATFAPVRTWLRRAAMGEIVLFSPQLLLITLLGEYIKGTSDYVGERLRLLHFLKTVPTGPTAAHPLNRISWADKVISPERMPHVRPDGRFTLHFDEPGQELWGSGRGGDWDRVALIRSTKQGPVQTEIRWRAEVVDEWGRPKEPRGSKL